MRVSRQISLPRWDDRAAEVARSYWTRRGFTVSLSDGPRLQGVRGSTVGTFFPFHWGRGGRGIFEVDWRRPGTVLSMTPWSRRDVLVETDLALVTLPGRQTDWATAYLRLEIAELHHVLWDAGHLDEVWRRFTRAERRATARWVWTKGLAGRRLSEEWEGEISELEVRFLLADDGDRG